MSKDNSFTDNLSYFKLTGDLFGDTETIILLTTTRDTLSFTHLLAQLKGNIITHQAPAPTMYN